MLFNSLSFVIFISATLLLYYTIGRYALVLGVASIIFYLFAGPVDTALFAGLIFANWAVTIYGGRARIPLAVLINIGALGIIKYWSFFSGGSQTAGSYVDIALPLGISFYTFQMLAYQVDVEKGRAEEASGFPQFALFVAFFPQLVAGPIVRARELLPQIEALFRGNRRRVFLISLGLALICLGIIKKVVFADSLAPLVDEMFRLPAQSVYEAWLSAYLFAFQIYFDFSGYSDIAVGAAYLFGIRLPFNFSTPYLSTSPGEFWQRWHITLSQWIRDYLYIPLGGSRGHWLRSVVVLIGVMGLAGLWHGTNMTFALWGMAWGIYIALGRLLANTGIKIHKYLLWLPHMAIVVMLWVLFRSPGLEPALERLSTMFGLGQYSFLPIYGPGDAGLVLSLIGCASLMILHLVEYRLRQPSVLQFLKRINGPVVWGVLAVGSILLIAIPNLNGSAFIYFRF